MLGLSFLFISDASTQLLHVFREMQSAACMNGAIKFLGLVLINPALGKSLFIGIRFQEGKNIKNKN